MRIKMLKTSKEYKLLPAKKVLPWGLRWLKPWVLRTLDWLKKYDDRVRQAEVVTYTIEEDKLYDLVVKAWEEAKFTWHARIRFLLIGAKQWRELTGDLPVAWGAFTLEKGVPRQFLGLEVIVVPWMDGVVVLPEVSEFCLGCKRVGNGDRGGIETISVVHTRNGPHCLCWWMLT